jgi:hypothetical protein
VLDEGVHGSLRVLEFPGSEAGVILDQRGSGFHCLRVSAVKALADQQMVRRFVFGRICGFDLARRRLVGVRGLRVPDQAADFRGDLLGDLPGLFPVLFDQVPLDATRLDQPAGDVTQ